MLRAAALGGFWTALDVVASHRIHQRRPARAGRADAAGPEGQVLAAEEQTAGRGRLGRTWSSVPGASLTFSVLLRPGRVPAGQARLAAAAGRRCGRVRACASRGRRCVDAVLKWPNDVLVGDRKLGGHPRRAVTRRVGGGDRHRPERRHPGGRAPGLPGRPAGDVPAGRGRRRSAREALLLAILRQLERWYAGVPRRPGPGAHRPARRLPLALRHPRPGGPRRAARPAAS